MILNIIFHLCKIRFFKQSCTKLGFKYAKYGGIKLLHSKSAFVNQGFNVFDIAATHHIHINTCVKSNSGGIRSVLGKARIFTQLPYCIPVAYYKAFKSELTTKYFGKDFTVSRSGDTVKLVKTAHYGCNVAVYCTSECGKIVVLQ